MLRRSFYRLSPTFMEIMMPALSPSMETGNLVKWNATIGSKITQGTSICSIQTDKAVVSFDHQMDDGYLAKLFAKEGETIEVGKLIAILVEEEADIAKADEFKPKPGTLAGTSATPAPASTPAPSAAPQAAAPSASTNTSSAFGSISEAIAASGPAVGRIAREVGEEKLKAVKPSGKNGRFTKGDVVGLAPTEEAVPAPAAPTTKGTTPAAAKSTASTVAVAPGKVYNFAVSDAKILAQLIARSPVIAAKKAQA